MPITCYLFDDNGPLDGGPSSGPYVSTATPGTPGVPGGSFGQARTAART